MTTGWIEMTKTEFIATMVTLGVRYKKGLFPNGAWKQEGRVLSAYRRGVLVGQNDAATGGWISGHSLISVFTRMDWCISATWLIAMLRIRTMQSRRDRW